MRLFLVLLVVALAGCTAPSSTTPTPPSVGPTEFVSSGVLKLESVTTGLHSPVIVTSIPDGTGRLVVAQQDGIVKFVDDGSVLLDASSLTVAAGERGFLGFAFHPEFTTNGVMIASFTDAQGDSILERYHSNGNHETLLKVDQPYANHNGGHVAFGPDGFLYYALGDGGSGGDPHGNGQDKEALLGSILRIDVGESGPYKIPETNPFGTEVWAKGLRNPWRFSFDRQTGDLYIGDVGQNKWEEINYQPASSRGGENYGWNAYEGTQRYALTTIPFSATTGPVAEYSHDEGCSVTGGYVLRGPSTPTFAGTYVFADYCSGTIWSLRAQGAQWAMAVALETDLRIVSFGEDSEGDVYVVDHAGAILRIVER